MRPKRPTETQGKILANAAAGRDLDHGRAWTQSAAAGWGCSIQSCIRNGWLTGHGGVLTDAGRAALSEPQAQERREADCDCCGERGPIAYREADTGALVCDRCAPLTTEGGE